MKRLTVAGARPIPLDGDGCKKDASSDPCTQRLCTTVTLVRADTSGDDDWTGAGEYLSVADSWTAYGDWQAEKIPGKHRVC